MGLWLMLPQRPAARDGSNCIHFQAMWQKHMHAYVCVINSGPSSWPSNERGCLNVVGVPCLQVASGAEEVVQHIKVVEQLQDALADTVGMCVCASVTVPSTSMAAQQQQHCWHAVFAML